MIKNLPIVFLASVFAHSAYACDILTDTTELRRNSQGAKLNLDKIAARHIPVGAKRVTVEEHMRAHGFRIYRGPAGSHWEHTSYAVLIRMAGWRMPLIEEDIQFAMHFRDGVVSSVGGTMNYRGW